MIGRPVEPASPAETPVGRAMPEGRTPAGMDAVGIPAAMEDVALDFEPSGPGWCQRSIPPGGP